MAEFLSHVELLSLRPKQTPMSKQKANTFLHNFKQTGLRDTSHYYHCMALVLFLTDKKERRHPKITQLRLTAKRTLSALHHMAIHCGIKHKYRGWKKSKVD